MKEIVKRLDADYGFKLTEREMELIAKQAEEAHRLFEPLFKVDLAGVAPLMKVDRKPRGAAKAKRVRKTMLARRSYDREGKDGPPWGVKFPQRKAPR